MADIHICNPEKRINVVFKLDITEETETFHEYILQLNAFNIGGPSHIRFKCDKPNNVVFNAVKPGDYTDVDKDALATMILNNVPQPLEFNDMCVDFDCGDNITTNVSGLTETSLLKLLDAFIKAFENIIGIPVASFEKYIPYGN